MRSDNIYEYTNVLERIFSVAYKYGYTTSMVEKEISSSRYFQAIEKEDRGRSPIEVDKVIVQSIFNNPSIVLDDVPTYNQCLWAAESYLRIQNETGMTLKRYSSTFHL